MKEFDFGFLSTTLSKRQLALDVLGCDRMLKQRRDDIEFKLNIT
jgi:hypothetical protein